MLTTMSVPGPSQKVKGSWISIAPHCETSPLKRSGVDHTVFYAATTPHLPFTVLPRKAFTSIYHHRSPTKVIYPVVNRQCGVADSKYVVILAPYKYRSRDSALAQ